MIRKITIFNIVLFLFSLLSIDILYAAESSLINSIVAQEIKKQKGFEFVSVEFDDDISTLSEIKEEEIISILVNDNRRVSVMINTKVGTNVLTGTYYGALEATALQASPLAPEPAEAGALVNEKTIDLSVAPSSQAKDNYILKKEEPVGKVAKRRMKFGKSVKKTDIEFSSVIKKGDSVAIRYINKNLLIEAVGISTEFGAIGDIIKVKNLNSNKILRGRVVDYGIIEVHNK